MGTVLLGIFIGATVIYYFSNRVFRHGINCFLLFFFRIPVKILEFIDRTTCGAKPVYNLPPIIIEPTPGDKPTTPKPQKTKPENVQSFRTPDGKQHLIVDSDELDKWLSKNPDLKIVDNT